MTARRLAVILLTTAAMTVGVEGQAPSPIIEGHEGDNYTRYELLAPGSAQFRIMHQVPATTPGARFYFNPIRKGSEASDEAVFDEMTGEPLPFKVVDGAAARASGLSQADPAANYLQVTLPRPVPNDGEIRLRVDKTYMDPKSYYQEGDGIVFARGLTNRRNAVVIPAGYEIVSCNVPAQVFRESDGRLMVSFLLWGPGETPLVVKARPLPKEAAAVASSAVPPTTVSTERPTPAAPPPPDFERLSERARQNREVVYFLQQPDTHSFWLYHDYTETQPGVDRYLNVVTAGSRVSNPSARLLDTGETLKVETLKGDQITAARLDIGRPVTPATDVVIIHFPTVVKGQSVRLRIIEHYTDTARYYIDHGELVWHRSLNRLRNSMVLPTGWYLTASSIPTVVTATEDGRVRLEYNNPRPDVIEVVVRAARRLR